MLYKVVVPGLTEGEYAHAVSPNQALTLVVRRVLKHQGFLYYSGQSYQWPKSAPLYSAVLDARSWSAEEVKPKVQPPVSTKQASLPFENRLAGLLAQI